MKNLIVYLCLAFSVTAYAGKQIDETLDVRPGGKISIDVMRGDVQIETWDKSKVRVTGELDDATKKFIFEVDGDDAEIKVKVDDGFFNRNWSSDGSDLTIYIPESSSVEAGGISTDFDVDGVQGGITVNSVSGDIDAQNIARSINIESVSGDIDVSDSDAKMRLVSVSGAVTTDGNAEHYDVSTISGDIEASIGLSELIDLVSVSGDVDIQFDLEDEGRIEAGTVSGDITLSFGRKEINASFDINTGPGGNIRNELSDDAVAKSKFIGSENIKFKLGNGSARVDVETMSGTIEITK
ncbi:MAG: DUF4097 and DUF4098 domain-containing protein YvlB [Arenicella sp.]|jgi:DUF4097 and DUF4098 domain-containing protein YvlB